LVAALVTSLARGVTLAVLFPKNSAQAYVPEDEQQPAVAGTYPSV
jgi:hypothetical protein